MSQPNKYIYHFRIEEIIGQKATNPLLWIGFIFYNFIPTGKELKLTLKETYYIIDQESLKN